MSAIVKSGRLVASEENLDARFWQLAAFTKCDKCTCSGFHIRPTSKKNLLDLSRDDIRGLSKSSTSNCAMCQHSLTHHLQAIKGLSMKERGRRLQLLEDYFNLFVYARNERFDEKKEVCDMILGLVLDALTGVRSLGAGLDAVFSSPPFETLSALKITLLFFRHSQNSVNNSETFEKSYFTSKVVAYFLKIASEIELQPWSVYSDKYGISNSSRLTYSILYARWLINCQLGRVVCETFPKLSQLEIFGKQFLTVVCLMIVDALSEKSQRFELANLVLQFADQLSTYLNSNLQFSKHRIELVRYVNFKNILNEDPTTDDEADAKCSDTDMDTSADKNSKVNNGNRVVEDIRCVGNNTTAVLDSSNTFTEIQQQRKLPLSPDTPITDYGEISAEIFSAAVKQYEKCKQSQENKMKDAEQNEGVSFYILRNDMSERRSREEAEWLTQLHKLFCVQLPKMPAAYVARIVYGKKHHSLIIHKKGLGVIGGICFRRFETQGFIEIVFCAIDISEQVRGYGSQLMNQLKDYERSKGEICYFLTYADENAVGYFRKNGFISQITLPFRQYHGYVKDYDKAVFMMFELHPRIIYTKQKLFFSEMQRLYFYAAKSKHWAIDEEFDGIREEKWKTNGILEDDCIPGFMGLRGGSIFFEAFNTTAGDTAKVVKIAESCRAVLKKLRTDKNATPFRKPVDAEEVPEYYETIRFPIDLRTIEKRIDSGYYVHERLFLADMKRMFTNCYKFNDTDTSYYANGYKLNELFNQLVREHFPDTCSFCTDLPRVKPTYEKAAKKLRLTY